jgi:cyclophilin family peptidyl-prolyl cis-trans isomerase
MLFWRWVCVALFLSGLNSSFAGTLVQFRSFYGDIEVELYDNDKPVTVQNFLRYVNAGSYQNGFFHRLATDPLGTNFVIQGGGFTLVSNTITLISTFPPITNEFGVGRQFSNVYGTIAMAKVGGDTNSATSQWYFNLVNNSYLDAPDSNNLFVVFGHVIAGTNVLNVFKGSRVWTNNPAPASTNLILTGFFSPPLNTLPVLTSNYPPTAASLVFVDISLLQVAIQPAGGGGHQISWNSVTGLTNVVEFTTNFALAWNTLAVTNGTGARMAVVDNVADPKRFYRVRVPF